MPVASALARELKARPSCGAQSTRQPARPYACAAVNLFDAYRYLAALAQHRHFGRAADACHITQPALSNALRALETQLAVAIVRRGRSYEGLTAEGEQVLATAHRVLREQETLAQALRGSAEQPQGRLVVGSVPTALPIATRFAARLAEQHPGLLPQVRSMSSQDIEAGLDTLALDIGLGYTERLSAPQQARLTTWPQYVEHYHLLQRAEGRPPGLHFGAPVAWAEAATLRLAMLSPEMHNRVILDAVFQGLKLVVAPALETNSVLALLVAVQGSALAAVLPGALVATLGGQGALLARPLVAPLLRTPVGFMVAAAPPPSQALAAALRLAADAGWLAHAAAHSGPLAARVESAVDHGAE
jgi:DNA-binding transcriptional LysR family regulator